MLQINFQETLFPYCIITAEYRKDPLYRNNLIPPES